MAAQWIKIYDLAYDPELVSKIQKATLETGDFGLVPEVALVGSKLYIKQILRGGNQVYIPRVDPNSIQ